MEIKLPFDSVIIDYPVVVPKDSGVTVFPKPQTEDVKVEGVPAIPQKPTVILENPPKVPDYTGVESFPELTEDMKDNIISVEGGSESKVSKKAEEHIMENHGSDSTVPNKSKFDDSFDIMNGINNALTNPNSTNTPTTNGRSIIEYTYKYPIGTNSSGKLINTIRVIIDKLGRVITAYPVK